MECCKQIGLWQVVGEKKKDKTKIKSNTPAKERGKRMKRANQKTKDFIERQKQKMGGELPF